MDNTDVIIIGNDFTKTGVAETKDYVVHALCTRGACSFVYNDRKYDFRKDNLLIIREHQLMRYIMPRHDFEVMVLYIHLPFIENITPDINFGIRSTLLLLENPILRLTKKEVACSLDDMNAIVGRVEDKRHAFRSQAIGFSCLQFFLDIFNFEHRIYGPSHVSRHSSRLIRDFIELLRNGDYKAHRDVTYYADKLFITAKYLSDVCRVVTGHPANYWINHFAKVDIRLQLRSQRMTVLEISEMFHFSSPAHFTRYVLSQFGKTLTAIREH